MNDTNAAALILPRTLANVFSRAQILVDEPHVYFARVAQLLNPDVFPTPGIHSSAVVLSKLPDSVVVGALSYIGEGCDIGEGVVIGAGCAVQDNCVVGANTRLHDRVTLYAGALVGARGILHSGWVIGGDGFGYARHRDGRWEKVPQVGRAVLGDDVEIGCNSTIDRGAMDDTLIGDGVKIDNLVQIGHNVRIGDHSIFAGQAAAAGSAILGKRVMVGGRAAIGGHIEIVDDVVIAGGSSVGKSIREAGMVSSVVLSQTHAQWNRNAVHLRHLDEMAKRIRALEKKLEGLESAE